MDCKSFTAAIPDLLLDPKSLLPGSDAQTHLESCASCRTEFASFQSTFALLDTWNAPEPSAYFDQKLGVLLREEQNKSPAGWLERLRSHLLFNTGRQFRPALAGALALALLAGGGTFAGLSTLGGPVDKPAVSATVDDLQILDKNAQAIQQMDQLLQEDQPADGGSAAQPIS